MIEPISGEKRRRPSGITPLVNQPSIVNKQGTDNQFSQHCFLFTTLATMVWLVWAVCQTPDEIHCSQNFLACFMISFYSGVVVARLNNGSSITLVSIHRQMSREIWKYGCLAKLFITQKYERPSCQKKRKKKDSIWPLL